MEAESEQEQERERFRDATLLTWKMEEGTMSQRMQAASPEEDKERILP